MMRLPADAAALTIVTLLLAGCGDADRPAAPTAAAPREAAVGAVGRGGTERLVNMMDACDPTTFNAALGPGSCLRQGGMKFSQFIAQLTRRQEVGAWHFAPPRTQVRFGQTLVAFNRGGEVHTFTEVAAFGGGIVPLLNTLAGTPTVAPECASLEADDFVPPGGTYEEAVDETGTQRFQCCIHPWMRMTVRVAHH